MLRLDSRPLVKTRPTRTALVALSFSPQIPKSTALMSCCQLILSAHTQHSCHHAGPRTLSTTTTTTIIIIIITILTPPSSCPCCLRTLHVPCTHVTHVAHSFCTQHSCHHASSCCPSTLSAANPSSLAHVAHSFFTQIPNGAAGLYLLGRVYRLVGRPTDAREHFVRALRENPLLWSAFEELCALGTCTCAALRDFIVLWRFVRAGGATPCFDSV